MTRWDYFPMQAGPCAPAVDVQGGWQITSYFGGRTDPITGQPGSHGGQDLAYYGCGGAHIYAPSAGTLSQSWDASGGGNWSGVTLDDGSYIGIGHAASFAPGNPYRRVQAGELIAYCDSTGGSTGDHVHVAYRPSGSWSYADPYDLLADSQHRMVGGSTTTPPPEVEDDMTPDELRFEMTGQRDRPTYEVYPDWMHDSRNYHVLVIYEHATDEHPADQWWVVFGMLKWPVPHGYEGWWDISPTALKAGDADPGTWQRALLDTCLELKVGPNGALQVATYAHEGDTPD